MRLSHKTIGVELFGGTRRREEANAEVMLRRASQLLRRAEKRARRAARIEAALPVTTPESERIAHRRIRRELEEQVAARLRELQELARQMEEVPAHGSNWSGRGSVRRVPIKPPLP